MAKETFTFEAEYGLNRYAAAIHELRVEFDGQAGLLELSQRNESAEIDIVLMTPEQLIEIVDRLDLARFKRVCVPVIREPKQYDSND